MTARAFPPGFGFWMADAAARARHGMFRTSNRIDTVRDDAVQLADARTAMCDYRLALATALGKPCDRNGFTS